MPRKACSGWKEGPCYSGFGTRPNHLCDKKKDHEMPQKRRGKLVSGDPICACDCGKTWRKT